MCYAWIPYAVAAVASAYGAYTEQQTASANAKISKIKAQTEVIKANDAIDRGRVEEEARRRQVAAAMGKQRSMLAAGGVELSSGSASELVADTAMLGELDALTVRNNAEREAWMHEQEAERHRFERKQFQKSGRQAVIGGVLGTGSALTGGFSGGGLLS